MLAQELQGYDPQISRYLVEGFSEGFKLGIVGEIKTNVPKNHKSAEENPNQVYLKLAKESLKGRIAGPFRSPPFDNLVCSPLGLVPKSDGKFRLIHDLSHPKGNSVNSLIPPENSVVSYDGVDKVIKLVKKFGRNAKLAKCDIEDAFRIVCIHPSDYHLLGFTWNQLFYYDRCLPMGASSSCQIFETLSCALQFIMETKYNAAGMSHILDDFLFVGPPFSDRCGHDLQTFLALASRVGIPMKKEKTVLPTTCLTIYGIEVDSHLMLCRLPQDKIEKISLALSETYKRKRITLRELQSLIGLLNFACLVVCPGRTFLRRLIDLTMGVVNPRHYIKLTKEARADLNAWKLFIESFNGCSMFLPDDWVSSDHLSLYSDASGSIGFASVFGTLYFAEKWPASMIQFDITVKELFPITLSLEMWGHLMQNSKVLFLCDNESVTYIINKQSSRDKVLMRLVRRLVVAALKYNILIRARHIAGKSNLLADHLSRFQFQKARMLAPDLAPHPTVIPEDLFKI